MCNLAIFFNKHISSNSSSEWAFVHVVCVNIAIQVHLLYVNSLHTRSTDGNNNGVTCTCILVEALKKKELELKKQKEEEDKLKKEEEERKKSEETDSKDKEDGRGEEKVEEPQSLEEPPVSPSPETVVKATDKEAESGTNKDASVEDTDSPHPSNIPNERKSSLFKQEAITDIANTNNGMSDSEKAFGLMYYESMLGLLASVLPKELSV